MPFFSKSIWQQLHHLTSHKKPQVHSGKFQNWPLFNLAYYIYFIHHSCHPLKCTDISPGVFQADPHVQVSGINHCCFGITSGILWLHIVVASHPPSHEVWLLKEKNRIVLSRQWRSEVASGSLATLSIYWVEGRLSQQWWAVQQIGAFFWLSRWAPGPSSTPLFGLLSIQSAFHPCPWLGHQLGLRRLQWPGWLKGGELMSPGMFLVFPGNSPAIILS